MTEYKNGKNTFSRPKFKYFMKLQEYKRLKSLEEIFLKDGLII